MGFGQMLGKNHIIATSGCPSYLEYITHFGTSQSGDPSQPIQK